MKKSALKIIDALVYPAGAVVVIALVWSLAYNKGGSEFIFPSIGATFARMGEYLSDAFFWKSAANTLLRVVTAFSLAISLALVTAVLAFVFPTFKKAIAPFVHIMISAPTVAFMIFLNLMQVKRTVSPVIVALTVVYPTAYASRLAVFSKIDLKLVEMAKLYDVPLSRRIFSLYAPTALPYIIEESGTIISFTLKIVVSGEIIAYTYKSLGGIINQANQYIEMDGVMALTVLSVLLALALEAAIKLVAYFYKRGKRL